RWECRPWYTEQGTIGGIIIYTEMITKQKEFEHELKKTKDYLETVLTHANAPIVVWDTSLTITLANQAFSSLFGLSVEQMIGHRLVEFEQYIPLQHRDALYLQLGTRKAIDAAEIEMAQSDGSNRTLLWNVSPMFNPDTGDLVAIIAQGQDISERKKIEQEHAGQLEELRRWYAVMTNREARIIALKREVNALLKYEGKAIRYASVEDETHA
ncbi:MAG: PAS domain S-box protein, partial [Spirochaetales bacterium]|nr:PAS domain S-box protein [Spirochaetales bacterium]